MATAPLSMRRRANATTTISAATLESTPDESSANHSGTTADSSSVPGADATIEVTQLSTVDKGGRSGNQLPLMRVACSVRF